MIAIINTMILLFTQHVRNIDDFTFQKDENDTEYLTYAIGITKTRQSGLHEKYRLVTPKMPNSVVQILSIEMFYCVKNVLVLFVYLLLSFMLKIFGSRLRLSA